MPDMKTRHLGAVLLGGKKAICFIEHTRATVMAREGNDNVLGISRAKRDMQGSRKRVKPRRKKRWGVGIASRTPKAAGGSCAVTRKEKREVCVEVESANATSSVAESVAACQKQSVAELKEKERHPERHPTV